MNDSKRLRSEKQGWYLLFWPVFGLRYLLVEQLQPAGGYHVMHCPLDDGIPFLEVFVIPYLLWHVCIIGMHLWLFVRKDPIFRQYSRYLMVSMGISTAIFVLYPTCQNLRPMDFLRDNLLTELVKLLYRMDTSTNVCPSEHVIGAAGFFLAAACSLGKGKPCRLWGLGILSCLMAIATVFIKQHSLLDLLAAVPVCLAGWLVCGFLPPGQKSGENRFSRDPQICHIRKTDSVRLLLSAGEPCRNSDVR